MEHIELNHTKIQQTWGAGCRVFTTTATLGSLFYSLPPEEEAVTDAELIYNHLKEMGKNIILVSKEELGIKQNDITYLSNNIVTLITLKNEH